MYYDNEMEFISLIEYGINDTQVSSLNMNTSYLSFHGSVAMLCNTEFVYYLSDSVQFACFYLSCIEEHGVDYESEEDISEIS